ncbi:MAG: OPT/YSL family transporter [Coriobacteriales bacterium]|jgi:uncharacterized oligopeptide transporter (OPT) family protein|nr:OPT/YSL family transporter [Coriobacteriales bacterium]
MSKTIGSTNTVSQELQTGTSEGSPSTQDSAAPISSRPFNQQFTLRGILIGLVGCVIITTSSVYIALRLGALPWPIFFVVLLALFLLKAFARKNPTNINEVNVAASVMSAGAMVAGGLAFTIPGIFILLGDTQVNWFIVALCALSGVALGMIGTALFRKHFIDDSDLPFPIGLGATETLQAGDEGGRKAIMLFASVGVAGLFTIVRDGLGKLPQMLFGNVNLPGVAFGIYCSPMALAMGFMIGPLAALIWILGGVVGNFGIVIGGVSLGFLEQTLAVAIRESLGIGIMIGCGVGLIFKLVVPRIKTLFTSRISPQKGSSIVAMHWAPFVVAAVVLLLAFVAKLGLLASIILVLLTFIVVTMAAQSTGQAGLNPMEIFGVIVLLVVALITHVGGIEVFLVAAVATVACGFVGDLMNDFKVGKLLGTDPKAQWVGVSIGGIAGALIGTAVIAVLVGAYGADAFGVAEGKEFVAAQASAVASMVGGISNLPAFFIGLLIGVVASLLGAPVIMFGLGVYLPFYLSLTVAVGAGVRALIGLFAPNWVKKEDGVIIASGLLGGESIVAVIFALVTVVAGLGAL